MKKLLKKLTAVVLAVVMVFGATPMSGLVGLELNMPKWLTSPFDTEASATNYSGSCGANLTWSLDTTTGLLAITGTGNMTDWTSASSAPWYSYRSSIKSVTIGNGVTSIGQCAFYDCHRITSIDIPGGVTCIGSYAFYRCHYLTSINIPEGVTSIGLDAFYNTAYYNNTVNWTSDVLYINNYLIFAKPTLSGSYVVAAGTRLIADWAFWCCDSLTSVTIPSSVTGIGYTAFADCPLTSINIPSSVTRIESQAFSGCTALTSVTIPSSVTSIGFNAFQSCTSLAYISIPTSVTTVGDNAFYNTKYYNNSANWTNDVLYLDNCLIDAKDTLNGSYVVATGTRIIADWALNECASLTSINIPEGVTSIGELAFYSCSSLTSINIPSSLTSIGDSAFSWCTSLTSINIPESVTNIGDNAFIVCTSLTSITVNNANANYSSDEFGVMFTKNKATLIQYPTGNSRTAYQIPLSVTSIGAWAFERCHDLTSINIPSSVTSIGYEAFSECIALTNIDIPSSVKSIGDAAFACCYSLTSINISEGVMSIGGNAFKYCGSLKSINMPASLMSIGDGALSCSSLTSIAVDIANGYYSSDEYGALFNNDKTILIQYPAGNSRTTYQIPSSVTSIGDSAFTDGDSLTNINIPEGVTSIGDSAFEDCHSLTSINIPSSVTSIGDMAFYYCNSLTSINIPEGVTSIGYEVFSECTALASVNIPTSVTIIESRSFLNTAYYNNVSNWTNDVLYIDNCLIEAKDTLSGSYIIETGTRVIADSAFYRCTTLTSVNIPASVTSIGNGAFGECASLTSVNIPEGVISIGRMAFAWCDSLKYVHIPSSVTTIDYDILFGRAYICSDTTTCYAKTYADICKIEFRVCGGIHYAAPVTGVTVTPTSKTLTVGATQQLTATVAPANATNKSVTYTSSNTAVATVSATGLITARSAGNATITVTTVDGGKAATCTVTVSAPDAGIIDTPSQNTVNYGDTLILHADITKIPEGGKVVWTSTGTGVKLTPSEDGLSCSVESKASETVTITAKVVDANNNPILVNGNEIVSTQTITSKAGFFQKLISFFKNLFGANRIISQAFDKVIW